MKIPFIDQKVQRVSLRTMKEGFTLDAKTHDNVTINLEGSAQYHVDFNRVPRLPRAASSVRTTRWPHP